MRTFLAVMVAAIFLSIGGIQLASAEVNDGRSQEEIELEILKIMCKTAGGTPYVEYDFDSEGNVTYGYLTCRFSGSTVGCLVDLGLTDCVKYAENGQLADPASVTGAQVTTLPVPITVQFPELDPAIGSTAVWWGDDTEELAISSINACLALGGTAEMLTDPSIPGSLALTCQGGILGDLRCDYTVMLAVCTGVPTDNAASSPSEPAIQPTEAPTTAEPTVVVSDPDPTVEPTVSPTSEAVIEPTFVPTQGPLFPPGDIATLPVLEPEPTATDVPLT